MPKTLLERFLTDYPRIKECAVQTFDDLKKRREGEDRIHAKIIPFKTITNMDFLNSQNEKGAGVFFSVNPMEVGERGKNVCTGISTWIVECDSLSKEKQYELIKKAPISPSLVIESKNSLHIYYFAKDGGFENYELVCSGLGKYYVGDSSLYSDHSRVLRFPGFDHAKDPDSRFKVEVKSFEPNVKYEEAEMLSVFPGGSVKKEPVERVKGVEVLSNKNENVKGSLNTYTKDPNDLWNIMAAADNASILLKLSGSGLVGGEKLEIIDGQIWCAGERTGCWIVEDGTIGVPKGTKGGPTWIQFCEYYKSSKSDIRAWYIQEFGDPTKSPKPLKKDGKDGKKDGKDGKDKKGKEKGGKDINKGHKYVYIKSLSKFYYKPLKIFKQSSSVAFELSVKHDGLRFLKMDGDIPEYEDICYSFKDKPDCLNLFRKDEVLNPKKLGCKPDLHPDIEFLLNNLCGNKEENVKYIHQAILYKYQNMDDFMMPCVVFHGQGGSGKGTFMNLLSTILGVDNVIANLKQDDLIGQFDVYKGDAMAVEFAEIVTGSVRDDRRMITKLKNYVMAENITVNQKGVVQYRVNNPAWFIISSNSPKPLHLDTGTGNRRFSIIRTGPEIQPNDGNRINKVVRDKEIVGNFLLWLVENYKDVLAMEEFRALENEDKGELEGRSVEDKDRFWDWIEEEYKGDRYELPRFAILIENFMEEMGLPEKGNSRDNFRKYVWVDSKYSKKKMKFNGKSKWGVFIE